MADDTNTVTTDLCEACGADVRPDSLFCYSCGGSLEKHAVETAAGTEEAKPPTTSNGSASHGIIKEGPGLTSAAAIQKRSRSAPRKPIQITWEPMDESSDSHLLIVSVALLVMVMLIVGIALYFK